MPTPLVGRETQVEQVTLQLAREDVRLFVLTGPGGVGKTRLGLQVAANVAEAFKDGVFYIPLESITRPDLVLETIAQTLGIQNRSKKPVGELLGDILAEQHVLLLLDNFEQVLEAASELPDLLAACAGLKLLVTSREVLHLQGEFDFPVPPLSLPDWNTADNLDQEPTPQLLQCEAVKLFVDRAVAAQPGFKVNRENAAAVAEICLRLDGLPLAIELAAARIRLLPPQEMLQRLEKSLSFLTRGATNSPSRQQTLRGTIDWSYALLDDRGRQVFDRLSVFAGGFTLEAAEEVCRLDDEDLDVLDAIASLEEKSLLRKEDSPGYPRFAMLETVREYAEERLTASGEAEQVRKKHAEYFHDLATKAKLNGRNRKAWKARLESEHNNLRSALAWSLGGRHEELGIGLACELNQYWAAGHLREGQEWYNTAMNAENAPPSLQARLLFFAGYISCELGETTDGMVLLEQSAAVAREMGDSQWLAVALSNAGGWAFLMGDVDKATRFLEESLALSRDSEIGVAARTLGALAHIAADAGDLDRAEALLTEGLAYLEEETDPLAAVVQMNLGTTAALRGDLERAAELIEQSLRELRQLGDEYWIAAALKQLGNIFMKQGWVKRSRAPLEEATSLFRELGITGRVFDGHEGVSHCLILFAEMEKSEGRIERTVRLLGASASIQEPADDWIKPWRRTSDDIRAASRAELGDTRFEAVWKEGQAMSVEDAVDYALETENSHRGLAPTQGEFQAGDAFPDGLSNREVEVAVLLVEGLTNREIGERLFISAKTVANHVQSILNKTGSGNRAEAAAYVIRNGLTD
jgi:non-specific serine/threonine protein kinase